MDIPGILVSSPILSAEIQSFAVKAHCIERDKEKQSEKEYCTDFDQYIRTILILKATIEWLI